MFEAMRNFIIEVFATHRTRKIGFVMGLITGGAILLVGFLNTIFIVLCGVLGLFIGSHFDSKDDLVEKLLHKLEEVLPENIQRW